MVWFSLVSENIFMAYGVQYRTNSLGFLPYHSGDRRGCDRMVVGFTSTYAISAYNH
jgi:hypothetical protein